MSVQTVTPIDQNLQDQVVRRTHDQIDQANRLFDLQLAYIPVQFNLKGRSAGMYRMRKKQREIRYNPWIFARYFDSNLAQTIPHEVAHYVVEQVHGLRGIKPHGLEWRNVMLAFGCTPETTCNYDLQGIPTRQVRRITYRCACRSHQLSSYRHHKIIRNEAVYHCRQCRKPLSLSNE